MLLPPFVNSRRAGLFCCVLTVFGACQSSETSSAAHGPSARAPEASSPAGPRPQLDPSAPVDVKVPPADAERFAGGVASRVLKAGEGTEHPGDNDCIKAHFTAWKRDGSLFSSSRGQKQLELTCLRASIEGLREPLKHMSVGEARRVWIPGNLTFVSSEPDEPAPNIDLTFDVELLAIVKGPATPADLHSPPASAKTTRSGVRYRVLTRGQGTAHPQARVMVRLRLTGFRRDGSIFESTELDDRPALVSLRELVPGLSEGVQQMVVGEKTRFWIPAKLAYGEHPRRRSQPAGPMVYDVELLAIPGP
jgi:peptidylprolyl isomerase